MKSLIQATFVFCTLLMGANVFAQYPGSPNPVPGSGPVPGSPYPGGPYPGSPTPQPAPAPCPAPPGVPAPAPGALAEIQIFYGYQGYNTYSWKYVSTQARPLSIDWVLRGWQTAACYKGDPNAALALFNEMVGMYNYQFHRGINIAAEAFYFYQDGKGALQIDTRDEYGNPFLMFPRMIECDRWSTPFERGY